MACVLSTRNAPGLSLHGSLGSHLFLATQTEHLLVCLASVPVQTSNSHLMPLLPSNFSAITAGFTDTGSMGVLLGKPLTTETS